MKHISHRNMSTRKGQKSIQIIAIAMCVFAEHRKERDTLVSQFIENRIGSYIILWVKDLLYDCFERVIHKSSPPLSQHQRYFSIFESLRFFCFVSIQFHFVAFIHCIVQPIHWLATPFLCTHTHIYSHPHSVYLCHMAYLYQCHICMLYNLPVKSTLSSHWIHSTIVNVSIKYTKNGNVQMPLHQRVIIWNIYTIEFGIGVSRWHGEHSLRADHVHTTKFIAGV